LGFIWSEDPNSSRSIPGFATKGFNAAFQKSVPNLNPILPLENPPHILLADHRFSIEFPTSEWITVPRSVYLFFNLKPWFLKPLPWFFVFERKSLSPTLHKL